jgi:hypothetical protein
VSAHAAPAVPARWNSAGRIGSPADVDQGLAAVRAAADQRASLAELRRPVAAAGDLTGHGSVGYLPVHPLLPWTGGLRRGATVAATGGNSLLLTLLAGAMSTGGEARHGGGRRAPHPAAAPGLVPAPGPDWPAAVAALLDGLDLVVVATAATSRSARPVPWPPGPIPAARSSVASTRPWPEADLVLTVAGPATPGWVPAAAASAAMR